MGFLRNGHGARLGATVGVAAPVSVVNGSLPFADPILPGYVWPNGSYHTRGVRPYREHDRRMRLLDAMTRDAQRLGLYDHDF